ncbi:MAG: hypothetical protein EOP86_00975 [Verrucomicrobiaceae bacterium]|nr:MAG: hypothetical protein EOP86_00975 [Verrucomicrobiaceae bacterium]
MNPPRFSPLLSLFIPGLLLTAGPARARLGETREECIARYGQPVAETTGLLQGAQSVSFAKAGIRVRIEFIDGRAAYLSFSKAGLSPDDELQLLESNADGHLWSKAEDYVGRRCWIAPAAGGDGARYASAYSTGNASWLEVASKKWTDAIRVQKTAMTAALPKVKTKTAAPAGEAAGTGSAPAPPVKKPGTLSGF